MHIYIYIYTRVDPCITCTELGGLELGGLELSDFAQAFLNSFFDGFFELSPALVAHALHARSSVTPRQVTLSLVCLNLYFECSRASGAAAGCYGGPVRVQWDALEAHWGYGGVH